MLESECSTFILPLCLATLANIDRSSFGRAKRRPHEEGLGFATKQSGSASQEIFRTGFRVKDEGFRWAPAFFLGESEPLFQDFKDRPYSERDDVS